MQWSLYNLCCRVKVFSHEKEIFDDKKKRQLEKCDIEFVRERKASEENKIEGKLKERWCKKLHDDTKKKETTKQRLEHFLEKNIVFMWDSRLATVDTENSCYHYTQKSLSNIC